MRTNTAGYAWSIMEQPDHILCGQETRVASASSKLGKHRPYIWHALLNLNLLHIGTRFIESLTAHLRIDPSHVDQLHVSFHAQITVMNLKHNSGSSDQHKHSSLE